MDIELVTIGDELILGFTIDTNGPHLARELAASGIRIVRRTTVGDGAAEIAAAVREALDRTGAVITSGGLGPTSDDLTKPAIAALFGRAMHLDERIVEDLRNRWRARGWGNELPAANLQQAMIPEGATILVNRHGSAPGIWLEDERGRWVAMLPGVPRELRGMLADELGPRLLALAPRGEVVRSRTLRTTGIGESALADLLADDARGWPDVSLAFLPGYSGTDLRLTTRALVADADRRLAEAAERLYARARRYVYGEETHDLAASVLELSRARGYMLAVAESCTGGMLGARITAIAGASEVFLGGIIAYEDEVKRRELGVRMEDLEAHGAVSEPVVRQMASGVRTRFGAGMGIAITGIAGPGGGSADKPVGTVWLAADVAGEVRAVRVNLIGDREEIRQRATQGALDLARRMLARADAGAAAND